MCAQAIDIAGVTIRSSQGRPVARPTEIRCGHLSYRQGARGVDHVLYVRLLDKTSPDRRTAGLKLIRSFRQTPVRQQRHRSEPKPAIDRTGGKCGKGLCSPVGFEMASFRLELPLTHAPCIGIVAAAQRAACSLHRTVPKRGSTGVGSKLRGVRRRLGMEPTVMRNLFSAWHSSSAFMLKTWVLRVGLAVDGETDTSPGAGGTGH